MLGKNRFKYLAACQTCPSTEPNSRPRSPRLVSDGFFAGNMGRVSRAGQGQPPKPDVFIFWCSSFGLRLPRSFSQKRASSLARDPFHKESHGVVVSSKADEGYEAGWSKRPRLPAAAAPWLQLAVSLLSLFFFGGDPQTGFRLPFFLHVKTPRK